MKKYLPSKKFIIITLIILGVLGIFGVARAVFKHKTTNSNIVAVGASGDTGDNTNTTVRDLTRQDSNNNGIPDWEESLWGLDPTADGKTNADKIAEQKKAVGFLPDSSTSTSTDSLTETEKFSREFFATVTALKQSGNLNEAMVGNISNVLSDKMQKSDIEDGYRVTDIKKTYDATKENQAKFYNAVASVFNKYSSQGLGNEFDSIDINTGSANEADLIKSSAAYQGFAKEVAAISCPNNLIQNDMEIINNANNVGIAVKNLAQIKNDPVVSLMGLTQYQKYSELFIKASEDLRTYLMDNGII